MTGLVPSCVWRVSVPLLLALDERFGEPVDAYVNGSQVWLRDEADGALALEWRLHPVAGFVRPRGVAPHELLERVVWALRTGESPPAPVPALWDGLEAFPAYGDEVEPAPLAAACTEVLGVAPDAYGLVDHTRIGDDWEQAQGKLSIVDALLHQLER
ncbi:MAG TPA: hypothetical protein VF855_02660 [Acidimicrobiales bacterium]